MKRVLQSSKLIPSKRQPPNLGNLLVKAKFSNSDAKCGSFKCGDKRCANCEYMNECNTIRITSTGRTFRIMKHMTCKSENVLYIITCKGCSEQYVGITSNTLAKRFNVHRQHIRDPKYRILGVSEHLDNCSNQDIKFSVTPFYKLSSDRNLGLIKEEFFINQFKPKLNKLN